MAQQNAHKVKIAARLRPRLKGELQDEGVWIERSDDTSAGAASSICVTNPRDAHQVFRFPFTSCYDEESTQEEIFENDVQPMIDVVFSGVTVTIFAYGVTSSGKTHTMQGTRESPGVIPRVVRALFEQKEFVEAHDDVSLSISYMEIYKDECYDLLVDRDTAPKLPVRENDVGQVFVANLSQIPIDSAEEFDNLYSIANKQRSVGATLLNRASSRSHAIVTLHVKMINSAENKTVMGKINLVDLAGSENNKLTGNDPSRMAESSAINKSLSVLGQVVHALNQGAARIPYRNSKLTRILQDALGGTSVGLLICNLAPGPKFRQDTLNTLNFAVRTKNVENKPVVNERDNRPAPKPHFAAVTSHVAPSKPANLPSTSAGSLGPRRSFVAHGPRHSLAGPRASIGGLHGPRPSVGGLRGHGPRPSLLPTALVGSSRVPRASLVPAAWGVPAGTSRVPRASNIGFGNGVGGANRRRSSGFGFAGSVGNAGTQALSGMAGLSEKEINEKISKLVELEVARRMEEKERERLRDEEARAKAAAQEADCSRGQSRSMALTPERSQVSLPSGLLTPLLKRHQDLDAELRNRLKELERKVERGNTDMEFAGGLSPVSRKKTGRAYVALARQHSEKGDLQVALDLFRKAETYVPDNIKLKERIFEIEYAVKHGKTFQPSPRRVKKIKPKKRAKTLKALVNSSGEGTSATQYDEDQSIAVGTELFDQSEISADGAQTSRRSRSNLSIEITQDNSLAENMLEQLESPGKSGKRKGRHLAGFGSEVTNGELEDVPEEEEEDEPVSPVKRARRKGKASADRDDDGWLPDVQTRNEEMAV